MTAIPLLGDISLQYVQTIRHELDTGFVPTPIAGLPGELQQRVARRSHQLYISGLLIGEEAPAQLETLQQAAASGEELTFAADITTALSLQAVVISSFRAVEDAGRPNRFWYELKIVESPPLPPPAELSGFGGLDDFGLGDLGFDTDILGDLQDLAGDIAGAVNDALDVIDQLSNLANLGNLGLGGGLLDPLDEVSGSVSDIAGDLGEALDNLSELFGT
jgi:hypothetical protein